MFFLLDTDITDREVLVVIILHSMETYHQVMVNPPQSTRNKLASCDQACPLPLQQFIIILWWLYAMANLCMQIHEKSNLCMLSASNLWLDSTECLIITTCLFVNFWHCTIVTPCVIINTTKVTDTQNIIRENINVWIFIFIRCMSVYMSILM